MGNKLCCLNRDMKLRSSVVRDIPEGILFSLGNPLLDILVKVPLEFLRKYKLKENEIRTMAMGNRASLALYENIITDVLTNYRSEISYFAGGSAQNSIRVAQWILDSKNACVFVGSIGRDNFGQILFDKACEDGFIGQYGVVPELPTGTCLVLLTGNGNRTILVYPAAAELLGASFLQKSKNQELLEKAKFYYLTAYSLVSSFELAMQVAEYAVKNNRHFIMHLGATYIYTGKYIKEFNSIFSYADIIIGGKKEALAFGESQNFQTESLEELALHTCSLPILNRSFTRMVVFTQGTDPVIVAKDNIVKLYKVTALSSSIKDMNGAGDAFAGGFLAQLVLGSSIEICVQCGMWAAAEVIQQEGCQFPKNKYFAPFVLPVKMSTTCMRN